MVKTTVYLPVELKAQLERVAGQRGQSEAEVIRAAIEQYTREHRPRPRLGLYETGRAIDDWDEAMRGFGTS